MRGSETTVVGLDMREALFNAYPPNGALWSNELLYVGRAIVVLQLVVIEIHGVFNCAFTDINISREDF